MPTLLKPIKKPKKKRASRSNKIEYDSKGKVKSRTTTQSIGSEILETHRKNTAQRQETKRKTAKYKAASRATLYGGVSAASTADDLSKTSANLDYTYPEQYRNGPENGPKNNGDQQKQPSKAEDPSGQVNTMQVGEQGSNPVLADDPKESHLKYDIRDGTYHD